MIIKYKTHNKTNEMLKTWDGHPSKNHEVIHINILIYLQFSSGKNISIFPFNSQHNKR